MTNKEWKMVLKVIAEAMIKANLVMVILGVMFGFNPYITENVGQALVVTIVAGATAIGYIMIPAFIKAMVKDRKEKRSWKVLR